MTHDCPKTKSIVTNGVYKSGCRICLPTATHATAAYAAKYHRDRQREDYRKDIIQRYDGEGINPEYVKQYETKAREQWGDDQVNEILRGKTNGRE